jgi:dephospho-CoA kinase
MSRPHLIGLTGSIGMGKSTTAGMFAALGVPVWDADAAVHRIYGIDGAAVAPMAALCPDAVQDGQVDRARLKKWIARDPAALDRIEALVHPLVAADRRAFVEGSSAAVIVLDVPLLFETGADAQMDTIVVVSTDAAEQRRRVMARGEMSEEIFERILAKQLPDAEKRARADVVIDTTTLDGAERAVAVLMRQIKKGQADA